MGRDALLRALVALQGDRADSEMATALGLSRTYWCMVRNGSKPLSDALIRRVRAAYPQLEHTCVAALLEAPGGRGHRAA